MRTPPRLRLPPLGRWVLCSRVGIWPTGVMLPAPSINKPRRAPSSCLRPLPSSCLRDRPCSLVVCVFEPSCGIDEAILWRKALDLTELTVDGVTFTLKARPAAFKTTKRDGTQHAAKSTGDVRAGGSGGGGGSGGSGGGGGGADSGGRSDVHTLAPGAHPHDSNIFLAWPTAVLEERAAAVGVTVEALAQHPPPAPEPTCIAGVGVPQPLVEQLRTALVRTLWPATTMRAQVESER